MSATKAVKKARKKAAKEALSIKANRTLEPPSSDWTVDPTGTWIEAFPRLSNDDYPRLDPYLIWAGATGFADMGGEPKGFFPISMEIKQEPDSQDETLPTNAREFAEAIKSERFIWMSEIYRSPSQGLSSTRYCTAHIALDFFRRLSPALRSRIERFTLGLPVVTGYPPRVQADKPVQAPLETVEWNQKLGKTVVAVIDDGIGFANLNFHANGSRTKSRVRCFWNQDDDGAKPTPGIGYGREYLGNEIDGLMQSASADGGFDETAFYREADYKAVARYWTHGTATLDLAAGQNPNRPPVIDGEEPIAALFGVQFRLPGRTIRDTSGLWLDAQSIDAFRYVVERSQALLGGGSARVFINLSYGYFAGPHDGSSLIEEAMDELAKTGACYIALPAGNSNLARCHGVLDIAPGKTKSLCWRVMPDCRTPSFVEIWLPDKKGEVELRIEPPGGGTSGPIATGNVATWKQNNNVVCTVVHRGVGARGRGRMILVALAPTFLRDGTRRAAPSGNWMIRLKNTSEQEMTVGAWVQRNDTPAGFPPHGRQSRFDDKRYPRFNRFTEEQDVDDRASRKSWIKHGNTLNSLATGQYTAVVGAYRKSDMATSRFSGSGCVPERQGSTIHYGPDAMAVTERSAALPSVLATGTTSGSSVPFEGTSAAAPQALRRDAADYALANPHTVGTHLPPETIRRQTRMHAQRQATSPPPSGPLRWSTYDRYELDRRTTETNVGAGNIPDPREEEDGPYPAGP